MRCGDAKSGPLFPPVFHPVSYHIQCLRLATLHSYTAAEGLSAWHTKTSVLGSQIRGCNLFIGRLFETMGNIVFAVLSSPHRLPKEV
jgi:hypothetical protein